MERARDGGIDKGQILRSEVRSDRLALELLAPTEEIIGHIKQGLSLFEQTRFITELLETVYGLPSQVARLYAAKLIQQTRRSSFADWLGF